MTYLFGYGIFLDPRCPARFGIWLRPLGLAVLRDWRRVDRGLANVERSPGLCVIGALYEVPTDLALTRADQVEGYPSMYGRDRWFVEFRGQRVDAWVYEMTPRLVKDLPFRGTLRWPAFPDHRELEPWRGDPLLEDLDDLSLSRPV